MGVTKGVEAEVRWTGEVDALVEAVLPGLVTLRRELHADPELQFQEFRTRQRVLDRLQEVGVRLAEPVATTDVVAELPGPPGAPVIGLRADMDALPIEEVGKVPWRSKNPGVMHACGHDGHTTILVGAALVLGALQERLPVGVRFIFQPAEEMRCGGRLLVQRGVCDGLSQVYALHGWPGIAQGEVQCLSGTFFAAADFFEFEVLGVGGHGAMPELAKSPMPAMAAVIAEAQKLHQELNAKSGAVVSVCSAHAGGAANNVIPATARLEGTARYLREEDRAPIEEGLQCIAAEVTASHDVEVRCKYQRVYDMPAVNDSGAEQRVAGAVAAAGGHYVQADGPTMGAEDFAFYLDEVPGAMFWLGVGEDRPMLHQPDYDFNDDALALGIKTFCHLVLSETTV
jgi:amidohydrolase